MVLSTGWDSWPDWVFQHADRSMVWHFPERKWTEVCTLSDPTLFWAGSRQYDISQTPYILPQVHRAFKQPIRTLKTIVITVLLHTTCRRPITLYPRSIECDCSGSRKHVGISDTNQLSSIADEGVFFRSFDCGLANMSPKCWNSFCRRRTSQELANDGNNMTISEHTDLSTPCSYFFMILKQNSYTAIYNLRHRSLIRSVFMVDIFREC